MAKYPILAWTIRLVFWYIVFACAAFVGDYLYVTFCTNFTLWGLFTYPFLKTSLMCVKGLQFIEILNTMVATAFWVAPIAVVALFLYNTIKNKI